MTEREQQRRAEWAWVQANLPGAVAAFKEIHGRLQAAGIESRLLSLHEFSTDARWQVLPELARREA